VHVLVDKMKEASVVMCQHLAVAVAVAEMVTAAAAAAAVVVVYWN